MMYDGPFFAEHLEGIDSDDILESASRTVRLWTTTDDSMCVQLGDSMCVQIHIERLSTMGFLWAYLLYITYLDLPAESLEACVPGWEVHLRQACRAAQRSSSRSPTLAIPDAGMT